MKIQFKSFNLSWFCLIPTICIEKEQVESKKFYSIDFNFLNKGFAIEIIKGESNEN